MPAVEGPQPSSQDWRQQVRLAALAGRPLRAVLLSALGPGLTEAAANDAAAPATPASAAPFAVQWALARAALRVVRPAVRAVGRRPAVPSSDATRVGA